MLRINNVLVQMTSDHTPTSLIEQYKKEMLVSRHKQELVQWAESRQLLKRLPFDPLTTKRKSVNSHM